MWYLVKSVLKKKYWWYIVALVSFLLIQVICEILLPIGLTQLTQQAGYASVVESNSNNIINDFTTHTALMNTIYISIAMLGMCLAFVASGIISGLISSYVGTRICGDIRLNLYRKIQDLSFTDIDKLKTSSLITRLTTDIEAIQNSLFMVLRIGLRSVFLFLGGVLGIVIVAFFPSLNIMPYLSKPILKPDVFPPSNSSDLGMWYLVPIILFAISMVMLGILITIMKKSSKQYTIMKYAIDTTNGVMRENILGVRVVKSFNLQNNQIERFKIANERLRKTGEKSFLISMWMFPVINLIMSWSVVITIWVGVATNAVDVSKIGTVMSITTLLLFGMTLMINVIMQFSIAIGSCKRVREILDLKPSIIYKDTGIEIEKPVIKFENVNFRYNQTGEYVLKNINLTINENETVGIIGSTGSGKSTFVSLISRMYDVEEGNLLISDHDIKCIDKHSLRKEIAFSPQKVTLFSGTINSNLCYGKPDATMEDLIEATKGAQAYEFIMQKPYQFEEKVEQRGRNFSGGQQQRLSIARALIKKPKILILDSSTSALDMITEKAVNEYIKETNTNRTTIMISQRISGVKLADRILVFEKGEIVGDGSHFELLRNNPVYREIAISQMGAEGVENELKER